MWRRVYWYIVINISEEHLSVFVMEETVSHPPWAWEQHVPQICHLPDYKADLWNNCFNMKHFSCLNTGSKNSVQCGRFFCEDGFSWKSHIIQDKFWNICDFCWICRGFVLFQTLLINWDFINNFYTALFQTRIKYDHTLCLVIHYVL
jgi:hypothetical protein